MMKEEDDEVSPRCHHQYRSTCFEEEEMNEEEYSVGRELLLAGRDMVSRIEVDDEEGSGETLLSIDRLLPVED